MPPADQILMGSAIAVMCVIGAWHSPWLIEHTRKGQRLSNWFGPVRAVWVLRGMLACGAVLGALLATGVVNPLRW